MNYLRYWSFSEPPFGGGASRFFFTGIPQQEVLSWTHNLVVSGKRLGTLVSPSGHGATTLLQQIACSSGFDDCATENVVTSGRHSSVNAVFADLARALHVMPRRDSLAAAVSAIESTNRQAVRTVWLIDEVGKHSTEAIREISKHRLNLTIVASVTPSLLRLAEPILGRSPRSELGALNRDQTEQFLAHSLQVGGGRSDLFSSSAIDCLYQQSRGRIRSIVKLADRALQLGGRQKVKRITASEIEAAKSYAINAKGGRTKRAAS